MNHKQLHAVFILSKPTTFDPVRLAGPPTWSHKDKDGIYDFAYHSFKGYYCDVYPPLDDLRITPPSRIYLKITESGNETTGDNHET